MIGGLDIRFARALMRLPAPLLEAAVWGRRRRSGGNVLDARAQLLLEFAKILNKPPIESLSPGEARRHSDLYMLAFADAPRTLAAVSDRDIPGPAGALRIRIYRPLGLSAGSGALVYYHGGGWVIGDLESHDRVCRRLADEAGCMVVAVDYRLGPEHRFPAAVEDAVAAYEWVVANGEALGIDRHRVAVGGDSAGGNLAAVVSIEMRSGARPAAQLLIYPGTDLTLSLESQRRLAHGYGLNRATVEWFREHYLRDLEDAHDYRASPLFARDLLGVPPAFVAVAGFDPLSDEGEAYAIRLREEAGVDVELHRYPSMVHGFLTMPAAFPQASELATASAAFVRRAVCGV